MAEAPASPGGGGSHESGDHSPRGGGGFGVREQDRYLPIANISRIMKKALPANGKIAKDAKETVQECVSEFISFVTSEASDKCQREKRKTINGDDLLWAMATLGFEDYLDPLKIYLARYREVGGDTKGPARGGETSAKRDGAAVQSAPNAQIAHQGSFSHGTNYSHSQVHHSALPMHGAE
ncbi:nuclear transcription factor Y subunit B-1-like isoform X1 [Syzygium oleosum]|uniref:nuclear transcription factor Y subunit B-1-like isoform X1 n=1 Tax=Syzygium oleosum TaxID=219896 RepID=UPI0024BB2587|nr:nuclear transcription factor Y subunit B-1-like isoform X1 [Syzygium oleosum]XP_056172556.1 nuclear transcription factor Y subunit B-1-like isoform X1 [Syzygium oleosum]